jgi:hypothetical protein
MEDPSAMSEGLRLLPVFLLHLSAGMAGSFTTILIHFFQHNQPDLKHYTTILGEGDCKLDCSGGQN